MTRSPTAIIAAVLHASLGYNPVCGWSPTGHSCPKRTYRLVPVESEEE